MVKSNLKEQKVIKKADLKVVDNNAVKTTAYSDINLKKWREYDHIKTDTPVSYTHLDVYKRQIEY